MTFYMHIDFYAFNVLFNRDLVWVYETAVHVAYYYVLQYKNVIGIQRKIEQL